MRGICLQIGLLVAITHGAIAIGRRVGHRRAGLLLGLPSTSALMLLGIAIERGADDASRASESCLLGLVAASAVPVVYLISSGRGWRMPWPPALAVLAYVAAAMGLRPCSVGSGILCLTIALMGVFLACVVVTRPRFAVISLDAEPDRVPSSPRRTLAVRTLVPGVYVTAIRTIRTLAGPEWSDLFMTFPGSSLAVMVTTHLELGVAPAQAMAGGLPAANLSTLAFLAIFRGSCLPLGPVWAALLGYLAASLVLMTLGRRSRSSPTTNQRKIRRNGRSVRLRVDRGSRDRGRRKRTRRSSRRGPGRKTRDRRKFSPRIETIRR